jgi:hypothetical protein
MPTCSSYFWPGTKQLSRQDNRPSGKSRVGKGFHPKKAR